MTEVDPYLDTTEGGDAGRNPPTPWPNPALGQALMMESVRARLFGEPIDVRVGRYRIQERLGAGGMGEVFLGIDDALGRKVAIKQVRSDRGGPAMRERLKREARALAKLSHPNVVQVYEVGEHAGETFLAMEFIEGQTLTSVLEQPRPWRDVLELFLAAGRGLAAAHAAGVVHRDFKPDNVLIDREGRARVVDFGLALTDEPELAALRENHGSSSSRLTNVGNMVGTLHYMSLEQLTGTGVDARSDQFGFCAALYEALYRQQPFVSVAAQGLAARIEALERDAPRTPKSTLPRGIWTVLRRGLRRDADARWPDLDTLLRELEAAAARRRRWAVGLVAVSAAVGVWLIVSPPPNDCASLEHELIETWGQARQAELRELFEFGESPTRGDDFDRIDAALDRWAAGWLEQRRELCQAQLGTAHVQELLNARESCLEQQRRSVEQLLVALEHGEERALEHVIDVLAEIPEPRGCAAAELMLAPPIDVAARERVADLRVQLSSVTQRRLLGEPDLDDARRLLDEATQLRQAPVVAEATAELGRAELSMGAPVRGIEQLELAASLAITARHQRLLGQVWLSLGLQLANGSPEPARGRIYCEQAEALWSTLGADSDIRTRLALCRAWVHDGANDHQAAIAALEAELPRVSELLRADLLAALADLSEGERALAWRREALAAAEREFGPMHRRTAGHAYALGAALLERGDPDARALLERAAAIWTRVHDHPHPDLCWAYIGLAELELAAFDLSEGRDEAALTRVEQHARACLAIHASTLAPDDGARGNAHQLLARVAVLRGDLRASAEASERALSYFEADGDKPHVLMNRWELATTWLSLGEPACAQPQIDRLLGADPASSGVGLGRLALVELALRSNQVTQALDELAHLDRATPAQREQVPRVIERALRILAELRSDVPGARARALALLEQQRSDPELSSYDLAAWLPEFELDANERELLLGED